ncbi:hypothetical protein IT407_00265 [Candidatus Uhrbacteria bacterium]|nr:hypothetical protein [Candidatus Uhrbacteria bacterium]
MKHMLRRGLAMAGSIAMIAAPLASQAAVTGAFAPGDLIKASGPAVYYFASNGKRYVFPNDKTYFTWYTNFDGIKQISDRALGLIPIGGNVTYRPGFKMVKITTDPRTYAVDQGGVLRHVKTEQLAETLFGLSWASRIDDIPDGFFVNYRVGNPIEMASEYNTGNVMTASPTIAIDKQLDADIANVSIGDVDTGFVPATLTIKVGSTVTWTNRDIREHTVTGTGWNSGTIGRDGSYSRKFSTVGSYEYKDTLNPTMIATINVVP